MKNSNVCESPIARDTLLVTYAESRLKWRVNKLLMECSMQQLHNELITSPYDGGLIGAIYSNTNDVIISDTMLCSLAPRQIRPMTYHHKMRCVCTLCNTSNYFQESLNAWRWKQLKIIKDKADYSHEWKYMN